MYFLVFGICIGNKVVEGSGSVGASKYVGEGVTYGVFCAVFLGTVVVFRTRTPADMPRQRAAHSLLMSS